MRDATGSRADMPPPVRANRTTGVTSTTHQDLTRRKSPSPAPIREKLGFADGLAREGEFRRDEKQKAKWSELKSQRDERQQASPFGALPREEKHQTSPFGARPLLKRREECWRSNQVSGIVFDAPNISPCTSPRGVSPGERRGEGVAGVLSPMQSPRQSPDGGLGKKQFGRAQRHATGTIATGLDDMRQEAVKHDEFAGDRAGAVLSQSPYASVDLGDNVDLNAASKTLQLREHAANKMIRQCKLYDPSDRINELSYRTREVATVRSKDFSRMRWR